MKYTVYRHGKPAYQRSTIKGEPLWQAIALAVLAYTCLWLFLAS